MIKKGFTMLPPINFKNWIEENRHLLKPPVGNKVVYEDTEFIIMVVGGPNTRKDYHIDEGEEFFYQLEGGMILRIIENGNPKDINISEGEMYKLSDVKLTGEFVIPRERIENLVFAYIFYCLKQSNCAFLKCNNLIIYNIQNCILKNL